MVQRALGATTEALASFDRAGATAAQVMQESPRDKEALSLAGLIHAEQARLYSAMGNFAQAAQSSRAAMEVSRKAVDVHSNSRDARRNLSVAQASVASALMGSGELEEAAAILRASVDMREQLVKEDPNDVSERRNLMVGYGNLGDLLGVHLGMNLGDTAGGAAAITKAVEIAEWLCAKDPADRKAQFDLASARLRLGALLAGQPERAVEGIRNLQESQRILTGLLAEDPTNYRFEYNLAQIEGQVGEAMVKAGRTAEGGRHMERAASEASRLLTGPDAPRAHLVLVLARVGIAMLRPAGDAKAVALADSVAAEVRRDPSFLGSQWNEATVYADLGRIYRRAGRMQDAVAWLDKSCAGWRKAKVSQALEARRQRELAAAESDLAASRRALKAPPG